MHAVIVLYATLHAIRASPLRSGALCSATSHAQARGIGLRQRWREARWAGGR